MSDEIVRQLLAMRAEGLNNTEIGRRLGVDRKRVSQTLIRAGHPVRQHRLPPAAELVKLLTTHTARELAAVYQCNPNSIQAKISDARKRGEIPRRPEAPPPTPTPPPPAQPIHVPEWADRALCRPVPNLFYAADKDGLFGGSAEEYERVGKAKAICSHCPVIDQCRDEADTYEAGVDSRNMLHGVWAGETPRERVKRRGAEQRGAA